VPQGRTRIEPRVGGTFLPGRGGPPGRIVALETNERVILEWPQGGAAAQVELHLEPKASGTALYLSKTGYPPGHEATVLHDRGMWSDLLVCLKNFVEGGDAGFANAYDAQVREA
jgi:uncharacterized protein YndB with AHSA1/START domain